MTPPRSSRTVWIVVAVLAVAGIAAITLLVAGGGGSKGPVTLVQVRPVTVTGTPLPAFTGTDPDPAVGTAVPRISGLSFGGTKISIGPGTPTLVLVISHTSADSLAEVPRLVLWHHADQTPVALHVVTVVTDTDAGQANYPPSSWLVREEWPWPVLADDEQSSAKAALGFGDLPGFVLIDPQGIVQYRGSGQLPIADLVSLLAQRLGV